METAQIIDELKSRRDKIQSAIQALSSETSIMRRPYHRKLGRPAGRRMSAATRKRISVQMRKRWALRKRASAAR